MVSFSLGDSEHLNNCNCTIICHCISFVIENLMSFRGNIGRSFLHSNAVVKSKHISHIPFKGFKLFSFVS